MVEEISETEARDQMETNLFGALWVTQAALPHLRAQGEGHIIQVSSIGGVCAYPRFGMYHASKWALEGLSEALAQEAASFGIKVTIVEPGGFDTDGIGSSARHAARLPAYDACREAAQAGRTDRPVGDPLATGPAILTLVDAADPPLRVFFGVEPLSMVTRDYENRLATWQAWQPLAVAAHGITRVEP
jgi:NAD(P)-dependent dehydrogenase (short-subunit alcohol dehydrogenase family)